MDDWMYRIRTVVFSLFCVPCLMKGTWYKQRGTLCLCTERHLFVSGNTNSSFEIFVQIDQYPSFIETLAHFVLKITNKIFVLKNVCVLMKERKKDLKKETRKIFRSFRDSNP